MNDAVLQVSEQQVVFTTEAVEMNRVITVSNGTAHSLHTLATQKPEPNPIQAGKKKKKNSQLLRCEQRRRSIFLRPESSTSLQVSPQSHMLPIVRGWKVERMSASL